MTMDWWITRLALALAAGMVVSAALGGRLVFLALQLLGGALLLFSTGRVVRSWLRLRRAQKRQAAALAALLAEAPYRRDTADDG